jgi:hypothetical protein
VKVEAKFNSDFDGEIQETHVFIQWKGTEVCLDFRCECGAVGHIDGMFVYAVRCAECGKSFSMPHTIQLVEGDGNGSVKDIPKEYEDNRDNGLCWACGESSGYQREFINVTLPSGATTVIHEACQGKELTDKPGLSLETPLTDWVIATGIPGAPRRHVERIARCVLLSDGRPAARGGIPWEWWPVSSVVPEVHG